jgi:small-conductance mechanosensitive channel
MMLAVPASTLLAHTAPLNSTEAACGPGEEASRLCLTIYRATGNSFLAGLSDTVIVTPAKVLLILVLAFVATRLVARAIRRFVAGMKGERVQRRILRERGPDVAGVDAAPTRRAAQRAETIGALVRSIITFSIWTVAVLMALGELGLNIGPLIAGAGIVGIALGFGAQNLVRDFLSGIFMLTEDQYGVGDMIDAGPAIGTVEAVSLRTTRMRDIDGVVWHIPNGTIERIGNKSQQWSRAVLDIVVEQSTDVEAASEVIRRVVSEVWQSEEWKKVILEEPEVWGVESLGVEGIAIRVVAKTRPAKQFRVARHLRGRIKVAFDEAGIEIPSSTTRLVWEAGDGDRAGPRPREPAR